MYSGSWECSQVWILRFLGADIFFCFQALQDPNVGDSWKHLLLEVVVTLAETAPAMVRKAGAKYMTSLIPLMLNMMTDLEDEEVKEKYCLD